MTQYLFFDSASTTKCCAAAIEAFRRYSEEEFGNPSSAHALGECASRAIRDSRKYFAGVFQVRPEQIIFTGSGSEADNLAIIGVAMDAVARRMANPSGKANPPRVLVSSVEHPAVRKAAASLKAFGVDVHEIPVDSNGQIAREKFRELLTPETVLVSIHQANNIVGAVLPVAELAKFAKERVPGVVFHTDAVQAFGKVPAPTAPSPIDLVSISAHKVEGPKGVGALVVLNPALLKHGMRPLIWGGEQEGGMRSGTQSAGLIAGFKAAAEQCLAGREEFLSHTRKLRDRLREKLSERGLTSGPKPLLTWNSPSDGVPHIVSLSIPGYPAGPLAKLLEERGCLVSTGSACSSGKSEPDPVLTAMGLPSAVVSSALRVSFSKLNTEADVDVLVGALADSIERMQALLGGGRPRSSA